MGKPQPLPERIETYEQYEMVLKRLRKGAALISDPLLDDPALLARYMKAYERMDKLLGDYSERMVGRIWDL